jgi:hypothetical protein
MHCAAYFPGTCGAWLFRATAWHEGGIYNSRGQKYLELEQFWGRAVRASMTRKGHGRFSIFGVILRNLGNKALLGHPIPFKEAMAEVLTRSRQTHLLRRPEESVIAAIRAYEITDDILGIIDPGCFRGQTPRKLQRCYGLLK